MLVKKPGPVIKTAGTTLDFTYADHFKLSGRTGYETLLYPVGQNICKHFPML